ncbi:MAG: NUDIX domain-containing protein [Pirellulales bacterium]
MSDSQPHPFTPKPGRPRRGAVGVIWHADRLLVIRRARTVTAPGMMCFPGGGIEAGETEEKALIRELSEELAAVVVPVRRILSSRTPWGMELAWWLAELADPTSLRANPQEVESFHWYTPAEMAALPKLLESNRDFLERAARGEIAIH